MEEMIPYDDAEAVAFIQKCLPIDLKDKLEEDDILYLIDLIYDFYESRGLIDIANDGEGETVEVDMDELVEYVIKNASEDGVGKFTSDEIIQVVQGEIGYCESIGMYEKE